MDTGKSLEDRVTKLEERNRRVEKDKAWETSGARKVLIAVFTYLSIAIYMNYVLQIDPWINAVVPTAGFLLSTASMSFFKSLWDRYHDRG